MSNSNPYAAPLVDSPSLATPGMDGGIYHALGGSLLIVDKRAQLPVEICVKSNTKAQGLLLRRMYWHPPAVYIALALNLLIYALLAVLLTKKASIHIALSDEWFYKRRMRLVAAWLAIFSAAGLFAIGLLNMLDSGGFSQPWFYLMCGGILLFLFASIAGIVSTRMVYPTKITDTHVFLRGVHRDFARRFPPWEGSL